MADTNVLRPPVTGGPARMVLAVATLPVTVGGRDECTVSPRAAERRIGQRDPDDVDTPALAVRLDAPLWSNDRDSKGVGVEWYTAARLLGTLDLGRG